MSKSTFEQASAEFRQFLPDLTSPRFIETKAQKDCYSYAETFQRTKQPPWLHALTEAWEKLYQEPFQGVTSDGQ